MIYKMILYVIFTLLSLYGLSGINTNNLFKTNKRNEAIAIVIVLSLSLSYLATNFIWDFVGVSSLF